ncbi:MAG: ABC transporter ATP-binding protein [Alphaproteobacteria bacterium]|nr:ABC transporter ATP-binding protein [Alphaproteobacteria bacterium]
MSTDVVLELRGLRTRFGPERGGTVAVDGVSFALRRGRTTALVGESGSGKSVTALSIMGLIEPPGHVVAGEILLDGRDLRRAGAREFEGVRGSRIGMVFQDPLTSLNPVLTFGSQIAETIRAHEPISRAAAEQRAVRLLEHVGVVDAAARAQDYPHHFSGGMRQRALIAAAIACRPDIIIADEPTTALDVTVQATILRLLHDLQQEMHASLLLITHDLGVVAAMADDVLVMYAGRVVERADVDTLFHAPRHPYTRALLGCATGIEDDRRAPLQPIEGMPPDLRHPPPGCRFAPRCRHAVAACDAASPALQPFGAAHEVACHRAAEVLADA